MSDARGYSYALVKAIQAADPDKLGVQLADFCLKYDIPAAKIAAALGVTRQTVYSWFTGKFQPKGTHAVQIADFMAARSKPQA